MSKQLILALGLLAALSGCSLIDSLEEMSMRNRERRCDRFGFTRGTDAFSNCMMQQQAMDEADWQQERFLRALEDSKR